MEYLGGGSCLDLVNIADSPVDSVKLTRLVKTGRVQRSTCCDYLPAITRGS